ncbi:MAG: T9SS type A sorting domain-containing protein [Burkholderiales bacterium]|nr:T9SS type A sorting domain-containing protein [Bacteroidia bacterium]
MFILLFCFVSLTIFSQSSVYKPFCNNPSWTTAFTSFGGTTFEAYQYQIDSTILGFVYKKIKNLASPFNYLLFREDVGLKRIYQYDVVNSLEYIYVDFALNVGNTFNVNANGGVTSTTVTLKDSMLINGCYHNVMYFSTNPGFPVYYIFVEGILSNVNPLNPFVWGGDPVVNLVCECHNGQTYYYDNGGSFNNFTCYLTCTPATQCSVVNSINELGDSKEKLIISPNPSSKLIFIKSEIDLMEKKYIVFDYAGQEVLSGRYNSDEGIDINKIESGIYILRVNNSFIKFIKAD